MNNEIKTTIIEVNNKSYRVKCPYDKVPELQQAAIYLDDKMKEIRNNSTLQSPDTITMMAAINITHELLHAKQQNQHDIENINKRINQIQYKVEEALVEQEEMAV